MNKKISLALLFIVFILSACQVNAETPTPQAEPESDAFELYLVANSQISGADLARYELDELKLAEDPLIATKDIVDYHWETQTINLSEDAYKKLMAAFSGGMPMSGLPFVITAHDERIYAGAFWSQASSLTFDGVVIWQPFDPAGAPLFITLGYPTQDFFTGEDPRYDERLKQALEDADLLR